MSGGSRITRTETSPWGIMPGAAGDTFEFAGQEYPTSMISAGGAFPQGIGQLPGLTRGMEAAGRMYTAGEFAPSYYPSQTYAGFNPAQEAAQEAMLNYAGTAGGPADLLTQRAQEGLTAGLGYGIGGMQYGAELAQPLSQAQYAGLTPFDEGQYGGLLAGDVDLTGFGDVASAYQQEAYKQLTDPTEGLLPRIRTGLVQTQPGGSTRGDLIQAKAIEAANQRMSDNIAKAMFGAYGTAQARRMPAAQMGMQAQQYGMGLGPEGARATQDFLGQYPSVMGAPLGMIGAVGDVGAQRRAMEQAGIDESMARYQYGATLPQNALQNYLASISGEWGGTTTATAPGQSPIGALLGGLVGNYLLPGGYGALAGAGAGASF